MAEQDIRELVRRAQDAADRHGIPFYLVRSRIGTQVVRLTSISGHRYLEKFSPRYTVTSHPLELG